jgi:hypothetical protein
MKVYHTHHVIFVECVSLLLVLHTTIWFERATCKLLQSKWHSICTISQLLISHSMNHQTLETHSARLRALRTLVEKTLSEMQTILFNVELALQEEKSKDINCSQALPIPRSPSPTPMTSLAPPPWHFAARRVRSLALINAGKISSCFHQSNSFFPAGGIGNGELSSSLTIWNRLHKMQSIILGGK